jgi:hypothetical protein
MKIHLKTVFRNSKRFKNFEMLEMTFLVALAFFEKMLLKAWKSKKNAMGAGANFLLPKKKGSNSYRVNWRRRLTDD